MKENNAGALFALFAIIGACSIALLPIGKIESYFMFSFRPLTEMQLSNSVQKSHGTPTDRLPRYGSSVTSCALSSYSVRYTVYRPRPLHLQALTDVCAAQGALRAPADATPPLNMHRSFIFNGVWCFATSFFVFFLNGRQARRERDLALADARQLDAEM